MPRGKIGLEEHQIPVLQVAFEGVSGTANFEQSQSTGSVN